MCLMCAAPIFGAVFFNKLKLLSKDQQIILVVQDPLAEFV
jgi:hypothetical protein